MLNFAKKIWPYNRSLTGKGNEQTLKDIKGLTEIKFIASKTDVDY